MKKLRNALIGVVAMTLLAIFTPSPAAAYTVIQPGSRLLFPDPDESGDVYPGTNLRSIYNSSGQKIGEYQLWVWYVLIEEDKVKRYTAYADLEIRDTLIGNGRGVKVKLMMKTGTNTSNVIGTYKGGTYPAFNRFSWESTYSSTPMWGFDVDHGEDWAGVPYRFTGKFDRYLHQYDTTRENWPFFNLYG